MAVLFLHFCHERKQLGKTQKVVFPVLGKENFLFFVGTSFVRFTWCLGLSLRGAQSGLPGFELETLTLAVALLIPSVLGLEFESWEGHSVMPLTGTEHTQNK